MGELNEKTYKKMIRSSTALSVIVSVTRKCVLGCKYCYASTPKNEFSTDFDLGLLKKIIMDSNNTRHSEVRFEWTGGEVLMMKKPFFEEVFRLQKKHLKKKYSNVAQTSGAVYDEELLKYLVDSGCRISITLDGDPEIHNNQRPYRNGQGSFDNVLKTYRYLTKIQGDCGVLCTLTKETLKGADRVFEFFRKEGINYWFVNPYVYDCKKPVKNDVLAISGDEYADIMIKLFDRWIAADDRNIELGNIYYWLNAFFGRRGVTPCDQGGRCIGNFINIEATGDVYLCPKFLGYSEMSFGNLYKSSIKDLISFRNARIRKMFNERRCGINNCMNDKCHYVSICNGGCVYYSWLNGSDEAVSHRDALCSGRRRLLGHIEKSLKKYMNVKNRRSYGVNGNEHRKDAGERVMC